MKKILSLLALFHFSVYSQSLKLGIEDSWPPFATSDGKGITRELVDLVCVRIKINCQINVFPYARILSKVQEGELDGGFNVAKQESTQRQFVFGEIPLLQAKSSFYFRDNSSKYKNISELPSGLKVGIIRGYEYGDLFESQKSRFSLSIVNTQKQLIEMLLQKRIDAIILYDKIKEYTLINMDLKQDIIYAGFDNHAADVYVAFSQKNPKAHLYAKQFDEGLILIKKSGEYDKITNQK